MIEKKLVKDLRHMEEGDLKSEIVNEIMTEEVFRSEKRRVRRGRERQTDRRTGG